MNPIIETRIDSIVDLALHKNSQERARDAIFGVLKLAGYEQENGNKLLSKRLLRIVKKENTILLSARQHGNAKMS